MIKLIARLLFCFVPALAIGLITSGIDPLIGIIFGIGWFSLGLHVTKDAY